MRLRNYIVSRGLDLNFGETCQVKWFGQGGRRWEDLLPFLRSTSSMGIALPHVMIIHLGGNSIGYQGQTRMALIQRMKEDMLVIRELFPLTTVLFSDILPRRNWRYQSSRSGYGLERTRRWINAVMSGFLRGMDMRCIVHRDIMLHHLHRDGVHLNDHGNDIFYRNICYALNSCC